LDLDNPRFFHLRHKSAASVTQEQIESEILENDDDLPLLTKSIQKSGVKDPIWVVKNDLGKYTVVEGNRRTAVLKRLMKEKVAPPPGISFEYVDAHVLPSDTPPVEVVLQKARLQGGKKAWGAFNEAALTYQLHESPFLMANEDIAVDLKIPMTKVRERIENYKLFREYVRTTGDENPKRFAYFAECPPKVRNWFNESPTNLSAYFKLISPQSKAFNKIRSVATRGGLRDFAQVLDDPEAMDQLLTDPHTSVEDALNIARDNDINKGMPFVKRVSTLAASLRNLNPEQIEKLRNEPKFKIDLKSLQAACAELVAKLDRK